jgi:hypothetical protein
LTFVLFLHHSQNDNSQNDNQVRSEHQLVVMKDKLSSSAFASSIHQSQSAFDKTMTDGSLICSTYNNHNNNNNKDGANSKQARGSMSTTINHDDNHNGNHYDNANFNE